MDFSDLEKTTTPLKYFVINLERTKNRLDTFYPNMKKKGFDSIERIEAVDGLKIDLNSAPLSVRTIYDLKKPRYDCRLINTKGAVGCYLSHVKVWQHMVDNNIESAIVIEDDMKPLKTREFLENEILSKMPLDADYLVLRYQSYTPGGDKVEPFWIPVKSNFFSTEAYFVTLKGAKTLLKYAFPLEMNVDNFVGVLAGVHPEEFKVYVYDKNDLFKDVGLYNSTTGVSLTTKMHKVFYRHNAPSQNKPGSPWKDLMMFIAWIFIFIIIALIVSIWIENKKFKKHRGERRKIEIF
jgi:glycosyl transferase family 25